MITFQSLLASLVLLVVCSMLAAYCGDRAGITGYGTPQNQKFGWTVLYIITLIPATLAFAWIAIMLFIWVSA